ncbi:hypothetical protein AB6A40_000007 [Gnathostoma spinigerum]|uniref:Sulfotransferase domain-containing protein n=1 Tax=Gnathostoma spinigerum TaxID=75299 RepID=A0ABD6E1A4_9BILA
MLKESSYWSVTNQSSLLFLLLLMCDSPTASEATDQLKKRYPQAIIIGVKKAGTRALLEFLRLNTVIRAPGPEVHFFDKHFDKGFEWYRGKMPETNSSEVTVEKTPAYFISKTAPQRIRSVMKRVKLIVVVRNPITRAISDYTQAVSKRRRYTNITSFEEMALKQFCDNSSSHCLRKSRSINESWGAIRIGIYHHFVERWLQYFPLNQFHFVDGERLVRSPASEIRRVERFLGLHPVVKKSDFALDPIKGFPCVLRGDGTLHCLGMTKGRPHPKVRADCIDALRRFYAPHNERFFQLINRRFYW